MTRTIMSTTMSTLSTPRARATGASRRVVVGNNPIRSLRTIRPSRATRVRFGEPKEDSEFRASVSGLTDPCDDFVCKSSPAVENTLKSLIKDINAVRGTNRSLAPYAPDVTYDDGVLKFAGSEKYKGYCSYIENNLRQATSRVTEISMEELDEATIKWELNAVNDIGKVGVDVVAKYKMNLITGRVLEHREVWTVNPARTEAQAGALLESTRKAHALPLNAMELSDKVKKTIANVSKSFSSGDEDDKRDIYVDPNDPMKFFQQEDTSKTDLLQLSLVASVIYLLTKVFELTS